MSDDHGPDAPPAPGFDGIADAAMNNRQTRIASDDRQQRKYLPTLADLVDRMTIVQLKSIFIPEHVEEYRGEMVLIMHDVDQLLKEHAPLDAEAVHAIMVLMLSNRFIWENESKARAGGSDQDKLLKLTHSVNGVRATAKNVLSSKTGGRKDYKIDALAADLPPEFGNWKVFG